MHLPRSFSPPSIALTLNCSGRNGCAEHIGSSRAAKTKIRDRPHLHGTYAVWIKRYLRALWRSDACPSSDLSHSLLWLTGPCASSLAASFSVSTGSPQVGSSSPSPHARGR